MNCTNRLRRWHEQQPKQLSDIRRMGRGLTGHGVILLAASSASAVVNQHGDLASHSAICRTELSYPRNLGKHTILQRASAPLKKADLLAVAHYLIAHLSYSQVPALAKRHKVEAKKDSASAQELLVKQVGTYEEAELCKLLLEISLLDSAYQRSTASRDDVLTDAAKRYRVDTEKLQKAVAKEFAAKRDKKAIKPKTRKMTV
jgi:hypothetical protein